MGEAGERLERSWRDVTAGDGLIGPKWIPNYYSIFGLTGDSSESGILIGRGHVF
jgi:hypothetical protein